LRNIETLLKDETVTELSPRDRNDDGRRAAAADVRNPAEVVIPMLILKHLFDWSYDDLERQVRANLV
jgi:hypothetical protein